MSMSENRTTKRKASLPILIAGGVSSLVLALGMSPTFSAFTASITNSTNTAGSGTLVMEEKNTADSTTCTSVLSGSTNTATCSTINKYGGNTAMAPNGSSVTNLTITNKGTLPALTFTVKGGTCTPTPTTATTLCAQFTVLIKTGATTVYNGTAAAFGSAAATTVKVPVAPNEAVPVEITVTLADVDNSFQGQSISQPITWTFGA